MTTPHKIRIIGGEHRSRQIEVIDADGLRPTSSRMRETLFNWLQFDVMGHSCLDLFAGSGALGIEALSRGAGHVTFIEKNPAAYRTLLKNIESLKIEPERYTVILGDALSYIESLPEESQFDLLLIDPPFHGELYDALLQKIGAHHGLMEALVISLEIPRGKALNDTALLAHFERKKSAKTKESELYLYRLLE